MFAQSKSKPCSEGKSSRLEFVFALMFENPEHLCEVKWLGECEVNEAE